MILLGPVIEKAGFRISETYSIVDGECTEILLTDQQYCIWNHQQGTITRT